MLKGAAPWKKWSWVHYALLLATLVMTGTEVYDRHIERTRPVEKVDITTLDEDIQEFNTMAEQLAQMEELPPVVQQWDYAKAVIKNYKLEMQITKGKTEYKGPLAAWGGSLSGHTGQVLAAAKRIQETVPTYLHSFSVNGNTARITFSVLGSE